MSALFVLIPLAMVFVFIAIGAFVWAARSGQYDDLDTPHMRVLFDDEDEAIGRSAGRESGSRGNTAASHRRARGRLRR